MKDSIVNRRRIPLLTKLRLAGMALRESGLRWFVLFGTDDLSSALAGRAFAAT
jgi:hypothetical protein